MVEVESRRGARCGRRRGSATSCRATSSSRSTTATGTSRTATHDRAANELTITDGTRCASSRTSSTPPCGCERCGRGDGSRRPGATNTASRAARRGAATAGGDAAEAPRSSGRMKIGLALREVADAEARARRRLLESASATGPTTTSSISSPHAGRWCRRSLDASRRSGERYGAELDAAGDRRRAAPAPREGAELLAGARSRPSAPARPARPAPRRRPRLARLGGPRPGRPGRARRRAARRRRPRHPQTIRMLKWTATRSRRRARRCSRADAGHPVRARQWRPLRMLRVSDKRMPRGHHMRGRALGLCVRAGCSAGVLTASRAGRDAGTPPTPCRRWCGGEHGQPNRTMITIARIRRFSGGSAMRSVFTLSFYLLAALLLTPAQAGDEKPRYILGKAYHIPSEYTNQESGYFSIIEGKNGRLYIGTAKYGVNAYLVEFDPKTGVMQMVVDVHRVIGTMLTRLRGPGEDPHAQQRRQLTGKIYFGTKQGYPDRRARSAPTIPAATSWSTTRRPARPRTSASRQSTTASSASRPTRSAACATSPPATTAGRSRTRTSWCST